MLWDVYRRTNNIRQNQNTNYYYMKLRFWRKSCSCWQSMELTLAHIFVRLTNLHFKSNYYNCGFYALISYSATWEIRLLSVIILGKAWTAYSYPFMLTNVSYFDVLVPYSLRFSIPHKIVFRFLFFSSLNLWWKEEMQHLALINSFILVSICSNYWERRCCGKV